MVGDAGDSQVSELDPFEAIEIVSNCAEQLQRVGRAIVDRTEAAKAAADEDTESSALRPGLRPDPLGGPATGHERVVLAREYARVILIAAKAMGRLAAEQSGSCDPDTDLEGRARTLYAAARAAAVEFRGADGAASAAARDVEDLDDL